MAILYNVYCDESCHLENDGQGAMVLGGVWCPADVSGDIFRRIREIKLQHGLPADFEVKWTKVSPGKAEFYRDLLDYFFDNSDLHFRALIVPEKHKLRHDQFAQTHDDWYYKMYFDMLKVIFDPTSCYQVYVDIKDTQSGAKVRHLHEVICNNLYDFSGSIVQKVQVVRSHEVELLQMADFLIGIVSYVNRGLDTSPTKNALVERMRSRSGYGLTRTTLYRENKVNLLRWQAAEL